MIHETIDDKGKHAPRFPKKNFKDIIEKELDKELADVLIVQAGSVDITNLKTDGCYAENSEYFKQQTVVSANNLFTAVVNAAAKHPELKKIIIMKQIPRYDVLASTIPGLKPFLSNLFNETLDQLWSSCFKERLSIGNHTLDCSGGVRLARYKDIQSARFDGVHMHGPSAEKSYTESVMKIISSAQLVKNIPPKYYDEFDHTRCPQTKNQTKQMSSQNQ